MAIDTIRNAVADALTIDPEMLTPETKFADLPEYDSLASLSMVVALDELGIAINPNDVAGLLTFGDVLKLAQANA